MTLPALSSGTTGLYNGVVIADGPADFAAGQLTALFSYEATFGVRQVDGYAFPTASLGLTTTLDPAGGAAIAGTTGTLTAAGLADFPALAGPGAASHRLLRLPGHRGHRAPDRGERDAALDRRQPATCSWASTSTRAPPRIPPIRRPGWPS